MFVLKQLRNEYKNGKKISQQKLADILGVSRSTVAMWENGLSQPDNDTLIRIAKYFNVSTDYLLGAKEKPSFEAGIADARFIKKYHLLTDDNKKMVENIIDTLINLQNESGI